MLLVIQLSGTEHIRVTDDRCQRRLELMGKGRDKVLSRPHLPLQLAYGVFQHVSHAVEVRGQLAQLVITDPSGTVSIVPLRHPLRSVRQQPYGLSQPDTDQQHHRPAAGQHGQSHPAIDNKTHSTLLKHLRHILQRFQIQLPVQRIDDDSRMYIIMPFIKGDLPDLCIRPDLLQKRRILRKALAGIQDIFGLTGQPQMTVRALPAALQL